MLQDTFGNITFGYTSFLSNTKQLFLKILVAIHLLLDSSLTKRGILYSMYINGTLRKTMTGVEEQTPV